MRLTRLLCPWLEDRINSSSIFSRFEWCYQSLDAYTNSVVQLIEYFARGNLHFKITIPKRKYDKLILFFSLFSLS